MIKAIIIDDEMHCLKTLSMLLKEYCPDVQVVKLCDSAEDGIEAIKKLKIRVPEQLAVLCFDDNDIFRLYTPSISVIRQPIEAIGQKAVSSLMERLRHSGEGTLTNAPVTLEADLVKRESI